LSAEVEVAAYEAEDRCVFFVLACETVPGRFELAHPAAPDALPYVARQARALALGRLRSEPWKLYELRHLESTHSWHVVVLTANGLGEARLTQLSESQGKLIEESIVAQDRWSGPVRPGELLPKAWEGKYRIRHGKPCFIPYDAKPSRETQVAEA
jgi:hypothetical protein